MLGTKQDLERQKPFCGFLLRKPRVFQHTKVNLIAGVVELSCHECARHSSAAHAFLATHLLEPGTEARLPTTFLASLPHAKLLDKVPFSIVVLIDQVGSLQLTKDPEGTREALEAWLPREEWITINPLLVSFP